MLNKSNSLQAKRYTEKFLFSLIIFAFLLIGCGEKTDNQPLDEKNKFSFDSTDIKTSNAENPNESFSLRYKLEKGKKYNYRLTTIARDMQTIQADSTFDQGVDQNIIYLFTITGKEVDNEGIIEVECVVNSIKLDTKAGNQTFNYESGKADSADRVRYSDYEALVNNPFSLRISKIGEIIEIFRVDKILNKYLSLKGYADSATVEEKNALRRDISESAIKALMVQIFREVPEKSLAKDSSWSKVQPQSQFMIFKTQNTNRYKIDNLEMLSDDKIAVIDAGMTSEISGNTKFTDRGISYDFKKPVTNAKGKIFFNITNGLVQKSKTRTVIDLSYSMEGQTPTGKQKGSKKETIENVNILELL